MIQSAQVPLKYKIANSNEKNPFFRLVHRNSTCPFKKAFLILTKKLMRKNQTRKNPLDKSKL